MKIMPDDKLNKILNKKIKESKIEKAKIKAKNEYNLERYMKEQENLVKKEKGKMLQTRNIYRIMKIIFFIAILIALYTKLIQYYPNIQKWILDFIPI